ncbi:MAG: cytochrome bo3 ubiquinol oxidase subunit 3 [Candidatus Westeberhardia cardiocondylae]|nr:cytochrome bo3 ubiquinol oxidase subunit 3 [Candidatus Westeberhardia cardiocondylae]
MINIISNNKKIKYEINNQNIKNIKILGFWIYLMSDFIMFAVLFIVYMTLVNKTFNGPTVKDIFKITYVFIETLCLLTSSVTYSKAFIYSTYNKITKTNIWLILTIIFGLFFVYMELQEFYNLIQQGYGPSCSSFLSSFFVLLGIHNIHVISGILWISIMVILIYYYGLTSHNKIRLQCLGLFWHFLDIIWIILITIVYLIN